MKARSSRSEPSAGQAGRLVTSGPVISRLTLPVYFHAPSPGALGVSAVRGLRATSVRAGLSPLPVLRPGPPLLRGGLRGGGASGELPGRWPAVPSQPRWPAGARGSAAALSGAPPRESDASASRGGRRRGDGARLAGDGRQGGARLDRHRGLASCHASSPPHGRARSLRLVAGFDCLADDPLGGLLLEPEDLHAITHEVVERTRSSAKGRVVAVLEGGYLPERMGLGAVNVLRALAGLPAVSGRLAHGPHAPA